MRAGDLLIFLLVYWPGPHSVALGIVSAHVDEYMKEILPRGLLRGQALHIHVFSLTPHRQGPRF